MTQPQQDRLLNAVAEVARAEQVQLMSQDLGDEAFAELSEAELQMLASAVSEQLAREPALAAQRKWRARGLRRLSWLAAAAALLGGGLWLAQRTLAPAEPVAERVPSASDPRRLTLPDGSTLALGEQTEARVVALDPRDVRVLLERGSVECDVTHDPGRRFVVAAGALEVVVKGTRFSVSMGAAGTAPGHVAVSVERGAVEVRQPPDRVLALLGAGQRWSSDGRGIPAPAVVPSTPQPSTPAPSGSTLSTPAPSGSTPSGSPLPVAPASGVHPAAPDPARAQRGEPMPGAPRVQPAPSARQLFERADAARLAGRASEAAESFDELRRRFPDDARAGYAAFMLGRIRLDSLADPHGAAEAFEFALQHAGRSGQAGESFFLEDAAARRVEALDKAGRTGECRAAREQFLQRYPSAVRAPLVTRLCER